MNMIDYIYYAATTTDLMTGSSTVITAQYFVPFFDFLMVAVVLSFTVLIVWFVKNLLYPNKYKINIRNSLRLSKSLKKKIWN